MSKKKIAVMGIAVLCLVLVYFALPRTDPHSGWRGQESLYWKGALYITCGGQYREGRTIGKTADGWDINEVEEDPSHTFLVARSFLDQYLFVREDYDIPASGTVTAASWYGRKQITDEVFCQAVMEIIAAAEGRFTYETDGIYQLTGAQRLYPLYLAYENCPLATEYIGYMGTLNGQWIITTHISYGYTPEGGPAPDVVQYDVIPESYIDVLLPYFP